MRFLWKTLLYTMVSTFCFSLLLSALFGGTHAFVTTAILNLMLCGGMALGWISHAIADYWEEEDERPLKRDPDHTIRLNETEWERFEFTIHEEPLPPDFVPPLRKAVAEAQRDE